MSERANGLLRSKNAWLSMHVDVPYPTKENLKGKELYLTRSQARKLTQFEFNTLQKPSGLELHRVDFHRLTLMFAELQASLWDSEEKANVLEFFTQIILDDVVELYVIGDGESLVGAFSVSQDGEYKLIADIVIKDNHLTKDDIVMLYHSHVSKSDLVYWLESGI